MNSARDTSYLNQQAQNLFKDRLKINGDIHLIKVTNLCLTKKLNLATFNMFQLTRE